MQGWKLFMKDTTSFLGMEWRVHELGSCNLWRRKDHRRFFKWHMEKRFLVVQCVSFFYRLFCGWISNLFFSDITYGIGTCHETSCLVESSGNITCVEPCSYVGHCKSDYSLWPYDRLVNFLGLGNQFYHLTLFVNFNVILNFISKYQTKLLDDVRSMDE